MIGSYGDCRPAPPILQHDCHGECRGEFVGTDVSRRSCGIDRPRCSHAREFRIRSGIGVKRGYERRPSAFNDARLLIHCYFGVSENSSSDGMLRHGSEEPIRAKTSVGTP